MAIDRNKVTAAAQKFIQKGAYKKAIKEYKKIIKAHPDDVRILLKIGDIQARDGQAETAARTYNEVADHYVAHGFFLKAVAAYKLLLGVEPSNVEAKLRLADLYFQLGLLRDALANYQAVAAVFNERGWIDRYLQTLQKVVEIDADHAGNRIKYAEELARFDHEVGAAEQFMIAASTLQREGRFEEYTKVMERYVHLSPADVGAVHSLCKVYLRQNRAKRSLVRIQAAFKADPRNADTVDILVKSLDALGERARAVGLLRELAQKYTAEGAKYAADDAYRRLLTLLPSDPEAMQALGVVAAVSPEPLMTFDVVEDGSGSHTHPASAGGGAPIGGGEPPEADEEEVQKLLSETDVYLKYNLYEKALEHLQKVFALEPQNVEGMERRKTALIATGEDALAVSVLIGLARIVHPDNEVRAMTYLHQAISMAPGDPAVVSVMTELGGEAPEMEEAVNEAVVVQTAPAPEVSPVSALDSAPVSVRIAGAAEPAPAQIEEATFEKLDQLFDDFGIEDTAAGHKVLGDEFLAQVDSEDEPEDFIDLAGEEILPAGVDDGITRAESLIAEGEVEDARMLLFELLGEYPQQAELLLRRMDELPEPEQSSEPEPEEESERDDLFLSESTFPFEASAAPVPHPELPPLRPPSLNGPSAASEQSRFASASVSGLFVEVDEAEELTHSTDSEESPGLTESTEVSDSEITIEASEPEEASDSETTIGAPEPEESTEVSDSEITIEASEPEGSTEVSGSELTIEVAEPDEAAEDEDEEATAEELEAEPISGAASASASGRRVFAPPPPSMETPNSSLSASTSGRRLLVTPPPSADAIEQSLSSSSSNPPVEESQETADDLVETPADAISLREQASQASDTVAAALEGDGLDVREDAIAEAELRQSGEFQAAKSDPFAALEKLVSGASTAVKVVSRDEPSATELEMSELESAAHEAALETDSEPVDEEAASSGADRIREAEAALLTAIRESGSGSLPAVSAPEPTPADSAADDAVGVPDDGLDEIEIGEFDDDDDVAFEDIEEGEFDDIDDSEFVDLDDDIDIDIDVEEEPDDRSQDAAFAAAARAKDIDAPIGRASSSVNQTFSPGDAVVEDDGGTGVGEAIAMRRSGAGMAAMFQLQEAESGVHGLAAGFELALANIEMGLYFEGISSLEQLLGNMELDRGDRVLVHYHLGIAYEAMDQQPLAEANFRVVAASAPDAFQDVYIRLERLAD